VGQPIVVSFLALLAATNPYSAQIAFATSMLFIVALYFLISRAYRVPQCGPILFFLGAALLLDTCICLFTFERFAIATPGDREFITQLSNAVLLFGGAVGANTIFASLSRF
jgi:hypothetical protein